MENRTNRASLQYVLPAHANRFERGGILAFHSHFCVSYLPLNFTFEFVPSSTMARHFLPTLAFLAAATLMLSSCAQDTAQDAPKPPSVDYKNELVVYLDSLERRYEQACLAMGMANWNSYSKEASYDLDSAKAVFAAIFRDSVARSIIVEWEARSSSLADKSLARRLELWKRCFAGGTIYADPDIASLENDLQQAMTDFRFRHNGAGITRAEAANRLRLERRQASRRALWSVGAQLSAASADDLIRLVKLRNERARSLGFPNYFSLSLHLQAIDESWLVETLNSLEEYTRDTFALAVESFRKKLRVERLGPWDFDYALREAASIPDRYFPSDSVFTILHRFERGIGFPVDSLPIREIVRDIPYNGLSLAITIPSDSRFLVNPRDGKDFFGTAFHEYGHSLKAVHTRVDYPILKGYEWIPGAQCAAYEEGVADLHREFTDDSLWLTRFTRAKAKQIERYVAGQRLPAMYRLRRLMKDFAIEYALYQDPDQDMARVEREAFGRYLLVDVDSTAQHQFASSIWYVSYPCYYQNYILAGMMATQLQEALTDKFGAEKIADPRVARWMIGYLYEHGERHEWFDRIRNATGKSLETGAYLRKLGIVPPVPLTRDDE